MIPGAPLRVLDVVDRGRLALDDQPLAYLHADGISRPVTIDNRAGRLLVRLVMEGAPGKWESGAVLAQAIQALKRCEAIGREALIGRGTRVRLNLRLRPGQSLAHWWRRERVGWRPGAS